MGLLDAFQDPQFRKDVARGLLDAGNRGAVAGLLGGPVDLATMVLRPFGYNVEQPVGGSEWIGQKMQNLGLVSEKRNPLAEGLAAFAGPMAAQTIAPKVFAAELRAMENMAKPSPMNAATRGQAGAIVWHGSPHKFDKFDSSKIGTGEGKQQQGMGAYLAEAQQVGQKYADKEAWKRGMDSGYLYKVDMPDEAIAKMANHDAQFSQQPKNVKDAITPLFGEAEKKALSGYHGWEDLDKAPFSAVLDSLEIARGNNRAATSQVLKEKGIPGIRYLDGGSRGAGTGTSNYVVFPGNENLLRILERNGQALP